jgi:hypothetical protein
MPSEKRVRAGRRNRELRGELSDAGREALRASALFHQPWTRSTGPVTAEGKAKAAANGKSRQVGPVSVRKAKAELAETMSLIDAMRAALEGA